MSKEIYSSWFGNRGLYIDIPSLILQDDMELFTEHRPIEEPVLLLIALDLEMALEL